jgi:hypothetical protein
MRLWLPAPPASHAGKFQRPTRSTQISAHTLIGPSRGSKTETRERILRLKPDLRKFLDYQRKLDRCHTARGTDQNIHFAGLWLLFHIGCSWKLLLIQVRPSSVTGRAVVEVIKALGQQVYKQKLHAAFLAHTGFWYDTPSCGLCMQISPGQCMHIMIIFRSGLDVLNAVSAWAPTQEPSERNNNAHWLPGQQVTQASSTIPLCDITKFNVTESPERF